MQIFSLIGKESNCTHFIVPFLDDINIEICKTSIEVLGVMGKKFCESISYLIPLLENSNDDIRIYAARVLGYIGPKAVNAIPSPY